MDPQAASENGSKAHSAHLATCSEQNVAAILSQIQGVLPAVNVLFEYGRQGAVFGQPNIKAFRLLDIAHHARLMWVRFFPVSIRSIRRSDGCVMMRMRSSAGLIAKGAASSRWKPIRIFYEYGKKVIASQQRALRPVG